MATIPTMTGEPNPAVGTATPVAADAPAGALPADTKTPPASGPPTATAAAAGQAARTLAVPIPTAIVAALVAGMFGMLFFSLNGLRSDIDTLRSDTNSQIDSLRSEMRSEIGSLRSDMNQRFAEVNQQFLEVHSVLLDHTDRLARIETHLDIGPPAEGAASDPSTPS